MAHATRHMGVLAAGELTNVWMAESKPPLFSPRQRNLEAVPGGTTGGKCGRQPDSWRRHTTNDGGQPKGEASPSSFSGKQRSPEASRGPWFCTSNFSFPYKGLYNKRKFNVHQTRRHATHPRARSRPVHTREKTFRNARDTRGLGTTASGIGLIFTAV
jgi:hypothetical protein